MSEEELDPEVAKEAVRFAKGTAALWPGLAADMAGAIDDAAAEETDPNERAYGKATAKELRNSAPKRQT